MTAEFIRREIPDIPIVDQDRAVARQIESLHQLRERTFAQPGRAHTCPAVENVHRAVFAINPGGFLSSRVTWAPNVYCNSAAIPMVVGEVDEGNRLTSPLAPGLVQILLNRREQVLQHRA